MRMRKFLSCVLAAALAFGSTAAIAAPAEPETEAAEELGTEVAEELETETPAELETEAYANAYATYTITQGTVTGGTITIAQTSSMFGYGVSVEGTPDTTGYIGTLTLTDEDGNNIDTYIRIGPNEVNKWEFTMPDKNVKVNCTFEKKTVFLLFEQGADNATKETETVTRTVTGAPGTWVGFIVGDGYAVESATYMEGGVSKSLTIENGQFRIPGEGDDFKSIEVTVVYKKSWETSEITSISADVKHEDGSVANDVTVTINGDEVYLNVAHDFSGSLIVALSGTVLLDGKTTANLTAEETITMSAEQSTQSFRFRLYNADAIEMAVGYASVTVGRLPEGAEPGAVYVFDGLTRIYTMQDVTMQDVSGVTVELTPDKKSAVVTISEDYDGSMVWIQVEGTATKTVNGVTTTVKLADGFNIDGGSLDGNLHWNLKLEKDYFGPTIAHVEGTLIVKMKTEGSTILEQGRGFRTSRKFLGKPGSTIVIRPRAGYVVTSVTNNADRTAIPFENNTFIFPGEGTDDAILDVTVQFEGIYTATLANGGTFVGGSLPWWSDQTYGVNDVVALFPQPDEGYTVGSVEATYMDGGVEKTITAFLADAELYGDGRHMFYMPAADVTINVTFTKIAGGDEGGDTPDTGNTQVPGAVGTVTYPSTSSTPSTSSDTSSTPEPEETKPAVVEAIPSADKPVEVAVAEEIVSAIVGTTPEAVEKFKEATFTAEEIAAAGDKDVEIKVEVSAAPETVSTAKETINTAVGGEYEVGMFIEINLVAVLGDARKNLTETGSKVAITLPVPADMQGKDVALAREHDGKVTILDDLDKDPATITVESDKFSTYAFVTKKAQSAASEPNASTGIALGLTPVLLAGAAVAVAIFKKRGL
ncbi:MAG: hypothetical protein NC299_15910 [Lachnospiraceae bacterium]|nr:hypothetical protein [Ruminococcus sp.]MCM1276820.1 hypothetical protein [Lachnospiraceae bacterium]